MKRILISLIASLCILAPALADGGLVAANNLIPICNKANNTGTDASGTDVCKDVNAQQDPNDPSSATNPVIKIIKVAVDVVSFVAGAAAVILIIISAIRFITSGGDSGKVAQARGALTYALVGIAITVLAQTLIAFVLDKV